MERMKYWINMVLAGRIKCSKCCIFCRYYRQCRMDAPITLKSLGRR